jgi:hypothetical protein
MNGLTPNLVTGTLGDPRQNFAGVDALRKGEGFDERIEDVTGSETLIVWEPL